MLTLADKGRPVRAVVEQTLEVEVGDEFPSFRIDSRSEHTFTGWGEPLDIEAPADDDIDRTPYIEEEAIAAYQDAPLLQPRGIPAGWVLAGADIYPSYAGDEGCDQLELDYTDPDDESYGYLYLAEMSLDCADTEAPPDSEPFTAGRQPGLGGGRRRGLRLGPDRGRPDRHRGRHRPVSGLPAPGVEPAPAARLQHRTGSHLRPALLGGFERLSPREPPPPGQSSPDHSLSSLSHFSLRASARSFHRSAASRDS